MSPGQKIRNWQNCQVSRLERWSAPLLECLGRQLPNLLPITFKEAPQVQEAVFQGKLRDIAYRTTSIAKAGMYACKLSLPYILLWRGPQVVVEQVVQRTQTHARLLGQGLSRQYEFQVLIDMVEHSLQAGSTGIQSFSLNIGGHQGQQLACDDLAVMALHPW